MPVLARRPAGRRGATANARGARVAPVPTRTELLPAADGTSLYVEEHGDRDAPLTVVVSHGWTLDRRVWDYQIAGLLSELRSPVRILAYDHRGHGRSEPTAMAAATLDQLADDLAAVVRQRADAGRLVLAGHSMGGMTIMALAEQHPELFAERVSGVVFVSTSCGGLDRVTYGLPRSLAPLLRRVEGAAGRVMTRGDAAASRGGAPDAGGEMRGGVPPQAATDPLGTRETSIRTGERVRAAAMRPGLRWLLFGERLAPADLDRAVSAIAATPPVSVVGFRATLGAHERRDALAACHGLPVVVACGIADRMCPQSHSRTIAQAVPGSQLVLYPKAGHMLPMERADEVTAHIASVIRSARQANAP